LQFQLMRILLVIDGMHPRDGGPPAVVAGSAVALRARGIDVTVLTTVQRGEEAVVKATWKPMIDAGANLTFIKPVGARELVFGSPHDPVLDTAIAEADVLHSHGFWNPANILAARLAVAAGKPYVISTHGVLDFRAMRRTMPKFLKKRAAVVMLGLRNMVLGAHAIVFGSEAEANQSWAIAPGMKKAYVPNGVDSESWNVPVSEEERAQVRHIAPAFDSWGRSLLFFARIHPEKGADMLVRAFNSIAHEFPESGLLIAGLKQDEAYQKLVERLVAETPDPSRIVFTTELTGPKSQFLYRLCDCYVLPSHAEGFSVALTEALSSGKPALITRYCHMPEVETAGAGFIVEPDALSIADGLRKLFALPPDELTAMGIRARSLYESNFTWARVAERLERLYATAAGEQNTAADR
jgi:glycosyltransferase involved in cell wall biosynthesis